MSLSPHSKTSVPSLIEEDTQELYENAPCGYLSMLPDGTIIKANATFLAWIGYESGALIGQKRFQSLLPVAGKIFYDTHVGPLLAMQGFVRELAFELFCSDGQRKPILLNAILKRDEVGQPLVIRTTILEASGRRAYEEELRRAKRKAENAEATVRELAKELEQRVQQRTQERDRIWRASQDIFAVASLDGVFLSFNPAFTRILGWSEQDLASLSALDIVEPNHVDDLRSVLESLSSGIPVERFEVPLRRRLSGYRWISMTISPEENKLYIVGHDISEERKQAEAMRKMEDTLRQTQKMEAIGKLTGGVAHDFNNILQVVAGNLELLKLEFAGNMRAANRIQQARFAVDRGAKLSSQLLAFARRQPLQPAPTNVSRVLREMDDLLRRSLGESIEIETIVSGGLWTTALDRNQFENVILNLSINARDAMNGTGKLTFEIGNAMLDEEYAQEHAEVKSGQYVMLAVSDTGSGMSAEVMEHIFEPFFTTKDVDKGTGLGLSMVYGFVKQSNGHIKVYSEIGFGTTFKIYLPRIHQAEAKKADRKTGPVVGGSETVLIVEDDLTVQEMVVDMISSLGYKVLKANDGQSALNILQSGITVDLMFTDVVMPGPVQSSELARQAKTILPGIAVLFTSGYTQNAIVHRGKLDEGVELISKPYRYEELARKIRQILEKSQKETPFPPYRGPATEVDAPETFPSLRILVVEDDADSQQLLCELLNMLGHLPRAASSAKEAMAILTDETIDVLLTDVGLPVKSGTELAREATASFPSLQVIFCSGYGVINNENPAALFLPKPYTLDRIMKILDLAAKNILFLDPDPSAS